MAATQKTVGKFAQERVPIRELDDEQARVLFDEAARYYLGISGEEFLRR